MGRSVRWLGAPRIAGFGKPAELAVARRLLSGRSMQMQALSDLGVSMRLVGVAVFEEGHLGWMAFTPACELAVEASQARALTLEETGNVGAARARNDGDVPVLLRADTIFSGGRQTRVVERTALVPPRASKVVAVRCVERQRWSNPSAETACFATQGQAGKRMRETLGGVRRATFVATGTPSLIQGVVWEEVKNDLSRTRMSARTSTESYMPILADVRGRYLARARAANVESPSDANAAVVLPFRGSAWVEVFPRASTLRAHANELLADLFEESERGDCASPIARRGVLGAAAAVPRAAVTRIPKDGADDIADSFALDAPSAWGSALFRERPLVHLAATVR